MTTTRSIEKNNSTQYNQLIIELTNYNYNYNLHIKNIKPTQTPKPILT